MKPSKVIAISAISAACAGLFVALGNIMPVVDYSLFLIASLFVMIPMLLGSYKGGILAIVASILIGVMFMPNLLMVLPYAMFFAPYAFLLCFCEDYFAGKAFGGVATFVTKTAFFVVSEILMWQFASFFVDFEFLNLPIYALLILGLGVLFFFDHLMKRIRIRYKYQLQRIFKAM